ncbi:hypothetical protein CYMTET_16032 [Cymbomonas tetramitiformis]|uniref:Intraflagellar transport protein 57 n=1 Tax=Cymbomonas tetramitiformis TaxID=36881 RepID=A0AAE0GD05_9CHLO|nr:hypothetical protein CYMTET_50615 [Cymbomonas tetramitiformis]KAK3275859.1 hypothetical protein CYMTET_16032 [Cymbomonas tetramitiformis]
MSKAPKKSSSKGSKAPSKAEPKEEALADDVGGEDAPAPRSKPVAVGRSLEIDAPADIAMENLLEKLKLLSYEKEFCRRKRPFWAPLTRTYFASPSPNNNQNEQFFYFTSLVTWLLNATGRNFTAPQQFDDPNAACTNILMELKESGFATPNFPPAKLKSGYGEAICGVLDNLADLVLEKQGFTWKKAVYQPDGYVEEAEVDEGADLGAEMGDADNIGGLPEPEEEEAYMEGVRGNETSEKDSTDGPLESKIDAAEWKLELERVGPQLRVTVVPDGKDWRTHLEQTHQHQQTIEDALPDSKSQLDRVESEVTGALEKITTREKFVNNQFEHLTREYRAVREQLAQVQERYNKSTENVAELTNELAHVSEELENIKNTMTEKGDNISDTSPLVKIKSAIQRLKVELKAMEVRIGVAEHALLQVNLKNKGKEEGRTVKTQAAAEGYDSEDGF